ncbi:Iron-sulfur cluster-binding protein [Candidatus Syntrophocurvum alkaliphilum]|uniref:Iron-sulfur cluster-binding protein n=1 Tax=Candidatus Syntrophocurvum alkaliphilum TaxID=2293317 RepID=A0A6I6DH01_9FIRM|nr:DUF362 domain-containing protein [Candidatus Syntrophocurvum alkaliphilum]QGU00238.1 Iron-sulfur cluster-binding protein [Candidatus Syntrophocurvum alkaliphilum]
MQNNDLYVIYGDQPKKMIMHLLDDIKVADEIPKDSLIGIKPNLVLAKPATSGATTSPEIIAGTIEYLQSEGFKNIIILESSWIGDSTVRSFRVCGYEDIAQKYGVELVDLKKDSSNVFEVGDISFDVCSKMLKLDYMINVPVLKGHCQTNMTCALKNIKGCIPDREKRRFHTLGLHKPIAYLNKVIETDLVIVDGIMGDLCYEEGGTPVTMNRIIIGKDPVLVDSFVAEIMGYELEDVPYIEIAEEIGVGISDLNNANITEYNKDEKIRNIDPPRSIKHLTEHIEEKEACSACYGSLVHALDRLHNQGLLNKLEGKIHIGQGFKDSQCEGLGVGKCTENFSNHIKGCPPKARDIIKFIKK